MALTTAQGSAAYLNRAFNNANASTTAFAATVADLTTDEMAAADKFDVPTLTDAQLSTQVLTNMGVLPSTNAAVLQLEVELAAYFGGMGKGHRGFVVLQLARILADKVGDATYGAAATAWNSTVAASVVSSGGVLTTAADKVTGSSGDDVYSGIFSGVASLLTFNSTDVIDGGAGNDTLKLDVGTTWNSMTTGSVKNVETLDVTNSSGSSKALDLTGFSGVTAIKLGSLSSVTTLANIPTGVKSIDLNATTGTFTSAFQTGAAETATTATTDALTLNLSAVGLATSTTNLNIDVDKIEVLNVVNTGTSRVNFTANTDAAADDLKTLNISGSGKITVANIPSTLTSIDASATTGGVVLTSTGNAGTNALKSISTGSGADTVAADINDLTGNAKLSGGAGTTDTLTLSSTSTTETAAEFNMSGFEILALGAIANTASNYTISGAKTTDLTTIRVTGGSTAAVRDNTKVDFVNMGTGAYTFDSRGATDDGADVSSDHTGAVTVNYTATGTSAVALTGSDSAAVDFSFPNATGALTVGVGAAIATASSGSSGATISAPYASSVALTVTSGKTAAGAELTSWDGEILADSASSVTVTATGALDTGAHISAAKATTATITNGTGASTTGYLDLDAAKLTSLSLTTGQGFDLAGSTLTVLESLTIAADKGTTTLSGVALSKANSVNLSGSGLTSAVTLPAVGSSTLDSNLALTATGLKAGLIVGNINVNSGYNQTINVSGVTGDIYMSDVNGASNGKSVDIKAAGVGGVFNVGSVYGSSTGTVSIDASNVVGKAVIGNVTGGAITVDLRGSGSGSYLGGTSSTSAATIAPTSSANISINELAAAKTYNVNATGTTSTALSVTFNGGVAVDTLNITGRSSTTSITATGNMGAGDDVVTIDNTLGATTGSTLNISGLLNYKSSTIYGSSGIDTITGGEGADTIIGGPGADILNGGGGADIFVFGAGNSTASVYDTITGLDSVDQIVSGVNATSLQTSAVTGSTTAVAISTKGIASFAGVTSTLCDTLPECVSLLNDSAIEHGKAVFFSFGGETFVYVQTHMVYTSDIVVKLAGVALPADGVVSGAVTGITGYSA